MKYGNVKTIVGYKGKLMHGTGFVYAPYTPIYGTAPHAKPWKPKTYYKDYVIHKVVKETWDDMWHAYHYKTWNYDEHKLWDKPIETYIRVPEKDALELFTQLL